MDKTFEVYTLIHRRDICGGVRNRIVKMRVRNGGKFKSRQGAQFRRGFFNAFFVTFFNLKLHALTSADQPLTEPTVSPLTKYFWKNGNIISAGPATTTAIAI